MKGNMGHEDVEFPTYHKKTRFQFLFRDFLSESSVHGLRYFIDYERHWLERVWWVAAFILSLVMCVIAVTLIWIDWKHHPVTVTFDDKMTSIAMIPFPAITICSTQKLKQNIQFPKDHVLIPESFPGECTVLPNHLPLKSLNKADALSQTCLKGVPQSVGNDLFANQSIFEAIEEISPDKKSIIFDAYWTNNRMSFVEFEPIFTREGLCFTFNSIDSLEIYTDEVTPDLITVSDVPTASDWNVEGGYQSNVKESELYPYRVFGTGFRNSLQITTKITPDHSFAICNFFSPGFMLSLHTPDELPPISDNYIFIPAQQNVIISIKPRLITTSESLRNYAPHDRGCYFRYERRLRFFRSYSQRKCELECLANFTENVCGCVRFYAPRDDGTNVCRLNRQSSCCSNAERNFMSDFMVDRCTCMPSCASVTYDVETSQVQLYLSEEDRRQRENDIQSGSKIFNSVISISFKESHFISVIRSETSTTSNFVANCGGLLGLFMGISMLSIVEIIYFFTLQLCCKIKRKRRAQIDAQYWVGRTDCKATVNELHRRKSY